MTDTQRFGNRENCNDFHLINELAASNTVSTFAGQIIVSISRFEVEHRLGNLLQQIYRKVDQRFPVRSENLSLVIRDVEGIMRTPLRYLSPLLNRLPFYSSLVRTVSQHKFAMSKFVGNKLT